MKYVDIILKYLSGDLSEKDARNFEKDLGRHENLREEFKQIKLIYDKLKEELTVNKGDSENREIVIREMLVEHDLNSYGGLPKEKDEIDFLSTLKKNIDKDKRPANRRINSIFRSPLIYLAIAASIAILMILVMPEATPEQIFAQYYKPSSDQILTHLSESSRGEVQTGILLYRKGFYKESIAHFKPYIQQEDADPYIRLIYALASIEENSSENLRPILKPVNPEFVLEIDYTIIWYYSLYLIHENEIALAKENLEILAEQKNPYLRQVKRILRKID